MKLGAAMREVRAGKLADHMDYLRGKAASGGPAFKLALLDAEIALLQERLSAAGEPEGKGGDVVLETLDGHRIEGKAMANMNTATERRFCFFLEELGGGPADGHGHLDAEALNADGATFDRAAELWYGTAEPDTDAERVALERWRTSPGESP